MGRHTTFIIQQDVPPKNNFNKHKPSNPQFVSNKGRSWNRNNFKDQKLSSQHSNDNNLDNNEHQTLAARRNQNSNMSNGNNTFPTKKESARYSRSGNNAKKDFRANGDEGSRYQRLRERQNKENLVHKTSDIIESKQIQTN